MGLIYQPTESDVLINAMKYNVDCSKTICEGLIKANRHLLVGMTWPTLSGDAYRAVIEFFENLINEILIQDIQGIGEIEKRIALYEIAVAEVGSQLLDEDLMNEELRALRLQESTLWEQIDYYGALSGKHFANNQLKASETYDDLQGDCRHNLARVEELIRQTEEKLNKLWVFNATVSGLFTESLAIQDAVMQRVYRLREFRARSSGSFGEMMKTFMELGILPDIMRDYNNWQQIIKNNDFYLQNIRGLSKFLEIGLLNEKKFAKYGNTGARTFNYLQTGWDILKKSNRVTRFLNTINKYRKPLERITKIAGWALSSNHVKKGLTTGGTFLAKHSAKLKWAGSVANKVGWIGIGINVSYDVITEFNKQEGSFVQKAGKGVVHAAVNQIKNAGPIEGAIAGGTLGYIGAGVGFGLGVVNVGWEMVNSKGKDAVYKNIENVGFKVVDTIDQAFKTAGETINKAWSSLTNVFNGGKQVYG